MLQATESPTDQSVLWEAWMMVEKGHLPTTRRLYARTIEVLTQELGNPVELTTEQLRAWIHGKGGSSSTVSNRISALASFYRFLVKTKVRLDNPTDGLDRPRRHKGLPKPVKDLEQTLEALDELDRKANTWGTTLRRVGESRDMATFLCETGLRIHEAVACRWPVPCPDQMEVIGKGAKAAIIPITPKAQEAWNRLGQWPIGARATQRRFEKAGFHPHQCRHWRGTSMAQAGADLGDIQAMLRHASPATTLTYSAWSVDRVRNALGRVT